MKRPAPPSHGVVRMAALDVRRAPAHGRELGSQLLMGEVVRLLRRGPEGRWWRVENRTDGYRGWVRSWGLIAVSARTASRWRRMARGRVIQPWVAVREGPGRGAMVSPLFWGGRVIAGRARGRFRPVELPDGRRGWVEARGLSTGRAPAGSLAARARELLGIPYLWGGRTPGGMDCSALVQLLMAERGVRLPRDAREQERASRVLRAREREKAGDLLFFGPGGRAAGHVAVSLGGGLYLHARGWVRLASLDPANHLCDMELRSQFRGVRRPPAGPGGATPTPRFAGRHSS